MISKIAHIIVLTTRSILITLNPKTKVDKNSHKDISLTTLVWNDGVKSLHIHFNKLNGYIEDNDESEYVTIILVDGNKREI